MSTTKRIAKNTIMLYFRLLFTMGVSLYTSRVILNALGIEDFGVYNIVGGIVSMFAILNSAMSSGTIRFLTFDIGKNDVFQLKKTFSASLTIHIAMAIIVLILAETIGLWFVMEKLVISSDRLDVAIWVYQFSILSFMIQITQVPYNATIIAHEKMNVFAIVSIIDAVLKLSIAFIISWVGMFDKLTFYSILVFIVSTIIAMIYRLYCIRKYNECRYKFFWDKQLLVKMVTFSSWDFFGTACNLTQGQGINVLLNLFFGTVVNAARGITFQINNAINSFASNFITAVLPRIVKLYAEKKYDQMLNLIFISSKFSFFLLWFISFPVLLETDYILNIWLQRVPEYTAQFVKLVLISSLIRCICRPVISGIHASGQIKKMNIFAGGFGLLVFPLSYVLFKSGFPPSSTFIVSIIFAVVTNMIELILLRNIINFPFFKTLFEVYGISLIVACISSIIPFVVLNSLQYGMIRFILVCLSSTISIGLCVYYIGMSSDHRKSVIDKIKRKLKK